jgi:anti-anti-sigma regulatory factor
LLLGAAGRARNTGGDLVVVSTEPRMRQRLIDTGFDRAVTVVESISGS